MLAGFFVTMPVSMFLGSMCFLGCFFSPSSDIIIYVPPRGAFKASRMLTELVEVKHRILSETVEIIVPCRVVFAKPRDLEL